MTKVTLVVAASKNGVIGRDGGLPWKIPSELQKFKALTMGKPVIMGRKTWDSLPRKPLPGRLNIVITRQRGYVAEGGQVAAGVDEAMAMAGDVPEVCVIGGGEIYELFLARADRIYLTEVDLNIEGDTWLPELSPQDWVEIAAEYHPAATADSASYVIRSLDRRRPV